MSFYLGLDNGETFIKAGIFNEYGIEVAKARGQVAVEKPDEWMTERNMELLWKENCNVIKKAIALSGLLPEEIRAVSFSGHGKGLYLADANGNPCTAGILSTDRRALSYSRQWAEDGTTELMRRKTAQDILACHPVCLTKWMIENRPERWEKARWIFSINDYIRFKMTGAPGAELTNFSGSGFVNVYTGAYDLELLQLAGIPEAADRLPPLLGSGDAAGSVTRMAACETGLAEGTICGAGLFDIDACAIGMRLVDKSRFAVIAGTWGINEYIVENPVLDGSVKMNSLYCIPGYYLAEESSPTSASNLEWLVQNFLQEPWTAERKENETIYAYVDRLAASIEPGRQNITFFPFLYGGDRVPEAKGVFWGITSGDTKAHMIRSVLEGVAFCHRTQLERMYGGREVPKAIRLGGGICNSRLWVQIFADVLKLPIELSAANELGALGAAMTASIACGDNKSFFEAAGKMAQAGETIYPNLKNVKIYEEKYRQYKEIYRLGSQIWNSRGGGLSG